jgi:hypothetical protein
MGRFVVSSNPEETVLKSGTPRLTFSISEVNVDNDGVELAAVAQYALVEKLASLRKGDELLIVGTLRRARYVVLEIGRGLPAGQNEKINTIVSQISDRVSVRGCGTDRHTPGRKSGCVHLNRASCRQQQSTGYSLSGNTVTFVFAPAIDSVLIANYRF